MTEIFLIKFPVLRATYDGWRPPQQIELLPDFVQELIAKTEPANKFYVVKRIINNFLGCRAELEPEKNWQDYLALKLRLEFFICERKSFSEEKEVQVHSTYVYLPLQKIDNPKEMIAEVVKQLQTQNIIHPIPI
jgi:hypothetical protein